MIHHFHYQKQNCYIKVVICIYFHFCAENCSCNVSDFRGKTDTVQEVPDSDAELTVSKQADAAAKEDIREVTNHEITEYFVKLTVRISGQTRISSWQLQSRQTVMKEMRK